jgi:hypothetical protein
MKQVIVFFIVLILMVTNTQLCMAQKNRDEKNFTKPVKLIINKKPIARKPAKHIIHNIELNGGIHFAGNGWGIQMQRLKRVEDAEGEVWKGFYVDISQVYHPKELKINSKLKNPNNDKGPEFLKYVYGKINVFLPVNIGYQYRKNFTSRLASNHIRLHGVVGAGLSFGIVKPYYLTIAKQQSSGSFAAIAEKYAEGNASNFLDERFIYGTAGFMKGWGELEIMPGLTTKAAIQFEYAITNKNLFVVEIGGQFSGYLQQVPIMATVKNSAIFPSMYVSVKKGARWFKEERD